MDLKMDLSQSETVESSQEVKVEVAPESDNAEINEDFSLELISFDPEKQTEEEWQEKTGLTPDSLSAAIETMIFMNDRPVSLQHLRELIHPQLPLRAIHDAILRLQGEYEKDHHGLRLQEVAQGYQFRTKALYSKYIQDLFKVNSLVLTPTSLEVLALIAYRQPISKADIEKIRGVDSSHMIRTLLDKRLVKIIGRADDWGRPIIYGTTQEFLEVFNLNEIADLPPEDELQAIAGKNEVGSIDDIREVVHNGEKNRFHFDEISEIDQLAESIKTIPADTEFTRSLRREEDRKVVEFDPNKLTAEGLPPVLPPPPRSAFDILEEHVNLKVVTDENQVASSSPLPPEENLFPENDRVALAKALDDVFAKMVKKDQDGQIAEGEIQIEEDWQQLASNATRVDEVTGEMMAKAADLDLNLDFLKEPNPEVAVESSEE